MVAESKNCIILKEQIPVFRNLELRMMRHTQFIGQVPLPDLPSANQGFSLKLSSTDRTKNTQFHTDHKQFYLHYFQFKVVAQMIILVESFIKY